MIDHTGVVVSDIERRKAFYLAAFEPIGYAMLLEIAASVTGHADVAGFGEAPKPDFWISSGSPNKPPVHVAIRVAQRLMVDALHHAAGGADNGAPGPRPHHHPNCHGGFVRGPDGHDIEAACHEPA
ncbi:VOC family protein [Massilia glaciei]|uniref:VOC family protein n=1 Tax=Massilia glaciei TaxID=1524097 RepID=A0A2U2HJQ3_9BURK|nr:VOC family protein [Massilia glaciei]PWF47665.1 VOC family protein [Massilia glaciei]